MKVFQNATQFGQKYRKALAVALVTSAGSAMAQAQTTGIDATAIAAGIVAAGVTIAVVGNARLIMDLGVRAFRWVRSALS